jgi:hypothetical protein
MPIVNKQQRGGWVIAHFTGSGAIYCNSANPLLGANSARETVGGMNIVSAEWSIGNNAHWVVSRGANTILNLTDGQHVFDMTDGRILDGLGGNPQANVVVTKTGSGPGTLILKLHKRVTITGSGPQY